LPLVRPLYSRIPYPNIASPTTPRPGRSVAPAPSRSAHRPHSVRLHVPVGSARPRYVQLPHMVLNFAFGNISVTTKINEF
jgi:hypothetical protein